MLVENIDLMFPNLIYKHL